MPKSMNEDLARIDALPKQLESNMGDGLHARSRALSDSLGTKME